MPTFNLENDAVPIDPDERLQDLTSFGRNQRQAQEGAAFSQLFDPTLSGRQSQLAIDVDKNRRARGLRGAAAQVAGNELRSQFEAGNRSASLNFLEGRFRGQSGVAVGTGPNGGSGLAEPGFLRDFRGTGSDVPGFQALLGEIFGLQSIRTEHGDAAFNSAIEQAQRGAETKNFRGAFENLFPGAGDLAFDVLDPISAGDRRISEIQEALPELLAKATSKGFNNQRRGDGSILDLSGENGLGGIGIRATPELISELGFDNNRVAALGLNSLNQQDLSSAFQKRFGESFFGGLEGVTTLAEARADPITEAGGSRDITGFQSLTGNTRTGGELGSFFTFTGDSPEAQARILANLSGIGKELGGINKLDVGGIAESNELNAIRNAVRNLDQIRDFQSTANAPLRQSDLLSELEVKRQGINTPRTRTETIASPLTGNTRTRTFLDPISESSRLEQLAQIDQQISLADRFRNDTLSPFTFS